MCVFCEGRAGTGAIGERPIPEVASGRPAGPSGPSGRGSSGERRRLPSPTAYLARPVPILRPNGSSSRPVFLERVDRSAQITLRLVGDLALLHDVLLDLRVVVVHVAQE